jgi:hypothetical protein
MANGAGERIVAASPVPIAGGRVIASPFQFMVTGEDHLRLIVANALTGCVIAVHGRFIDQQGHIQAFADTFTPTADRLMTSKLIPLGVGFILNLTVFAAGGAPRIGQTFVKVDVIRGFSGATVTLGTMLQGYISSQQGLGWPGSAIQNSLEVTGVERLIVGATPAAGADIAETVPTGARWQVLTARGRLVTDATVVNRQPFLRLDDATVIGYYVQAQSVTIGASGTMFSFWASGAALNAAIATQPVAPLPTDTRLVAGERVLISATNLQAADQWDQARLLVREWLAVE